MINIIAIPPAKILITVPVLVVINSSFCVQYVSSNDCVYIVHIQPVFCVFGLISEIIVFLLYFVNYFVRVKDFFGNVGLFFTQQFKNIICN